MNVVDSPRRICVTQTTTSTNVR